ncbi:MAG: tRNA pseudouridine(65) synthase TruC [Phaeodactylibacter sp.]|nr:tRNA pseudouridine(65) synthase TruC [Phaeodactylibacter sp.]
MQTADIFNILFEDEYLVAIDKPSGIMVHRTRISEDTRFVLQLLRDQLGRRLYPVHRLDRGTSGVLVFGKTREAAALLSEQFRDKGVGKKYLAIIRGYVEGEGTVDYPIARDASRPLREAVTHYTRLGQSEIPYAVGRYATARYSLVEARPVTGRHHQVRRHFAHIRHPVIGDKKHGDVKHNKFMREQWGISRLLLHASSLAFVHPVSGEKVSITAPLDDIFRTALGRLRLPAPL